MSQLKALLHHYYPVEIDPHWTIKENLPHMVEWNGYKMFFNTLFQNSIPLFIFSTGIGDIVEEIIQQMKKCFTPASTLWLTAWSLMKTAVGRSPSIVAAGVMHNEAGFGLQTRVAPDSSSAGVGVMVQSFPKKSQGLAFGEIQKC
ncbi:hypothetical protein CB1_000663001 [Camelus ferus]|nr:hypothetical protein CB1_000663001 [Camelus ferus]